MSDDKPGVRLAEMFEAVKVAARGNQLTLSRSCDSDVRRLGYDAEFAIGVVAEVVEIGDVVLCEPDDKPERPYHMMAFEVELEEEPVPFYVKVGLCLPDLSSGRLVSFHLSR